MLPLGGVSGQNKRFKKKQLVKQTSEIRFYHHCEQFPPFVFNFEPRPVDFTGGTFMGMGAWPAGKYLPFLSM
jgi:hypothetical protein